jgi:FKBP-type peptidyl-prolyl cis-trans isomerase
MKKQIFYLGFGILFLLSGALIVGKVLLAKDGNASNYRPATESTTYKPNTSPNTQNTVGESLQVQGSSGSRLNNQLPTPESFEIYEQYSDQQGSSYIDIVVGTGKEAESGDNVAMLYQGWLTNGQLFDQSRLNESGQIEPFVFQLGGGQVIQGWEQGIVGMKEGGKRRLIIPSSAGYGPNGQDGIPPNAMLIFDVELLGIQKTNNLNL